MKPHEHIRLKILPTHCASEPKLKQNQTNLIQALNKTIGDNSLIELPGALKYHGGQYVKDDDDDYNTNKANDNIFNNRHTIICNCTRSDKLIHHHHPSHHYHDDFNTQCRLSSSITNHPVGANACKLSHHDYHLVCHWYFANQLNYNRWPDSMDSFNCRFFSSDLKYIGHNKWTDNDHHNQTSSSYKTNHNEHSHRQIYHRRYKTPPVLNMLIITLFTSIVSNYFSNHLNTNGNSYTVEAVISTSVILKNNLILNQNFSHLNRIVDNPQLPISDSSFTRQDNSNDNWNNNHISSNIGDTLGNKIEVSPNESLISATVKSSAILSCLISSRSKLNIQWSRYLHHQDITEQISPQLNSLTNNIVHKSLNTNFQKKSLILSDNLTSIENKQSTRSETTITSTDPTIAARFRQQIKEVSDILIESSLAITPVETRDNASYFCIASDNLNNINKAKIDLLVLSLPIVRLDRIVPSKNPRSALIFWTIISDGNTPIRKTILMIKNDSLATDPSSVKSSLALSDYLGNNNSGGSVSSLVIDEELNQWHRIDVGNKDFIRNYDTEGVRYNLRSDENDNNIASVDSGASQASDMNHISSRSSIKHRSYNLTSLLPGVTYSIKLAVINDVGQSDWTQITTTMPSDVPERINEVFLETRTNSSLMFAWRRPYHDNGAKINRYEMQLFDLNKNLTFTFRSLDAAMNISVTSNRTNYMYYFVNLRAGTEYDFHVRACSRLGCGSYSYPRLLASTIDGESDEPSSVEVICNDQNGLIVITWIAPPMTQGVIVNYNVTIDAYARYRNQTNQWTIDQYKRSFITKENQTNRFEASILLPNTNYSVRVCANNRAGICGKLSHLSENTQCSTSPTVPISIPHGIQLSHYRKRETSDKQTKNLSNIPTMSNNEQRSEAKLLDRSLNQLIALNFPQINQRNGSIDCIQVILIRLPTYFNSEQPLETYLPQSPEDIDLTSHFTTSDTTNIGTIHNVNGDQFKKGSSKNFTDKNIEKQSIQAYIAEELDLDNLATQSNLTSIVIGDEIFSTCTSSKLLSDSFAKHPKNISNNQNEDTSSKNHQTTSNFVFDGRLQPDTFYTGFLRLLVKTTNRPNKSIAENLQQDDAAKFCVKYSDYFEPIKTGYYGDSINIIDSTGSDAQSQSANLTLSARYKSIINSITEGINFDTLSEMILKSSPLIQLFEISLIVVSVTLLLLLVMFMIRKIPTNVGEHKVIKQLKGSASSRNIYHQEQKDQQFIDNRDNNIGIMNWEENNHHCVLNGPYNPTTDSMLIRTTEASNISCDDASACGQAKAGAGYEIDRQQYIMSGSKTLAVRRGSNKCSGGNENKIHINQSGHEDGALTLNHNNLVVSMSKKFNRSIPLKSFCAVYECRLRNGWLKQEFEQLPKPTTKIASTSFARSSPNVQGIVSGINGVHLHYDASQNNNSRSNHCLQHINKNATDSSTGNGNDSSMMITSDTNDNTSSAATNNGEMTTTAIIESSVGMESTHHTINNNNKRREKRTSITLNPYLIVSTSSSLNMNGGQPLSVVVCGEETIDANFLTGHNTDYFINVASGVSNNSDLIRQQANLHRKTYICSKSPTDADSVWDFWRMVYEYDVPIIVMLTPIEVNGKFKCAQYWPTCDNEETTILSPRTKLAQASKMLLAKFKIRQKTLNVLQDYTVRLLTLMIMATRPDEDDEIEAGTIFDVHPELEELVIVKRDIIHFQCHNWKSFYVFSRSLRLIKFIEHVDEQYSQTGTNQQNQSRGPILVHCRSGSGRSGIFVAVDLILTDMTMYALQQSNNITLRKEDFHLDDAESIKPADEVLNESMAHQRIVEQKRLYKINIFDLLSVLRFQRTTIIRSYKQYKMIYHSIAEYYLFGDTEFHTSELDKIFNHYKNLQSIPNGIENEFLRLDQLANLELKSTYVSSLKANLKRNRYDTIVPYDENRVILPIIPEGSPIRDQTSYINASFVQNPNDKLSFIVTQNPLDNTIGDFWKMIYFQAVDRVLMISSSPENMCPQYWPDEDGFNCDYLSIRMISETMHAKYIRRTFDILNIKPQLMADPYETKFEDQSINTLSGQIRSRRHKVTQYQYLDWHVNEPRPTTIYSLLELITAALPIEDTNNCIDASNNDNMAMVPSVLSPVVIHCDKGNRSSVVVVLTFLMRQIMREQRVDLVQTCRLVRSQRIGLINAPSQYDLIYRCLLEYVNQQGSINVLVSQSMDECLPHNANGPQQIESSSQYQAQLANGACPHVTSMLPIVMA